MIANRKTNCSLVAELLKSSAPDDMQSHAFFLSPKLHPDLFAVWNRLRSNLIYSHFIKKKKMNHKTKNRKPKQMPEPIKKVHIFFFGHPTAQPTNPIPMDELIMLYLLMTYILWIPLA